jgi:hypothetical protein
LDKVETDKEEILQLQYYYRFVKGCGFTVVNIHKAIKTKDITLAHVALKNILKYFDKTKKTKYLKLVIYYFFDYFTYSEREKYLHNIFWGIKSKNK